MKLFISAAALLLFSATAQAKTCDLTIDSNDAMQFSTKELVVEKDCKDVKITLKHTGKLPKSAMGHNIVITSDKDMQAVVTDSLKAGLAKEYLPPEGDARVIAASKLIGGGETTTASFKVSALKAGEAYKFFCTFPGHSGIMNGVLTVKK
jgi:azurin